jgi:hypothetical protein
MWRKQYYIPLTRDRDYGYIAAKTPSYIKLNVWTKTLWSIYLRVEYVICSDVHTVFITNVFGVKTNEDAYSVYNLLDHVDTFIASDILPNLFRDMPCFTVSMYTPSLFQSAKELSQQRLIHQALPLLKFLPNDIVFGHILSRPSWWSVRPNTFTRTYNISSATDARHVARHYICPLTSYVD